MGERATATQLNTGTTHWSADYVQRLHAMGFKLTEPARASSIALQSEHATQRYAEWAAAGTPIEANVVIVPPTTSAYDLPASALGYVATALNILTSIQNEQIRQGQPELNIPTLRIISPAHVNAAVNGNNEEAMLANGKRIQRLVERYIEAYRPDWAGKLAVVTDAGNVVTEDTVATIAEQQHNGHNQLHRAAARHRNHTAHSVTVDEEQRVQVYSAAHPEAWRMAHNGILFEERAAGVGSINIVPQSELAYFVDMVENRLCPPEGDPQTVVLVSARHQFAPYHSHFDGEPTLGDILDSGLDVTINRINTGPLRGNIYAGQTKGSLNQIKTDIQTAQKEAKRSGATVPTLTEILTEALGEREIVGF